MKSSHPTTATVPTPCRLLSIALSFRLKFASLCKLLPRTEKVQDEIFADIRKDLSHQPESWIAVASYQCNNGRASGALAIFD